MRLRAASSIEAWPSRTETAERASNASSHSRTPAGDGGGERPDMRLDRVEVGDRRRLGLGQLRLDRSAHIGLLRDAAFESEDGRHIGIVDEGVHIGERRVVVGRSRG